MRKSLTAVTGLVALALVSLVGCEWSGSNNDEGSAWNTSVFGVGDFSGKYGLFDRPYVVSSHSMDTNGSFASGVTGPAIYSLYLNVEGNSLNVTDSSGMPYGGRLTHIAITTNITYQVYNTGYYWSWNSFVITNITIGAEAQFEAIGVSKAGKNVRMYGNLQAGMMQGTWVETAGKIGDIRAVKQ